MTLFSFVPLELTFPETVWSNVINALATAFFTASLVAWGAAVLVHRLESQENLRRDNRSKTLLKESEDRAEQQKQLDKEHDDRQQLREHEYQMRSALRESYARLLVVQRRSRQESLTLSRLGEGESRAAAKVVARQAHDDFIDEYHRLALDADRSMWFELRALRHILDDMLKYAELGAFRECESLTKTARDARQNLERSLRRRLGHPPLQRRNFLGEKYDKARGLMEHARSRTRHRRMTS
ncbi:hypothetical protein [Arthrobacter sp. QXT-31]|uniref:hypothetical protein n=1 Tax=Arthrobacter sp. QXT-31 TaxID=1357915 RepID=UPI000971AED3|nr:hypothetical protein [Arthrobacter sp. QXT-31]APX02014.1 hypothetical protein BWQ92_10120 [Arthrobacter sp. QXT-31]